MNNEYTPEQLQEMFNLAKVLTTIVIAIFIAMWIILFIQWTLDVYVRNKWVKNQNEHDKAVIAEYKHQQFELKRKNKSKKNEVSSK